MVKWSLEQHKWRKIKKHEGWVKNFWKLLPIFKWFFDIYMSRHKEKRLCDFFIFMPYMDHRHVWPTYFFMVWFLWTMIKKNPYLCFLGQRLLKFWVCFQFQERIMHRMLFFEYFFLFPAIFDVLYFAMERLTLLHFMLLFLFEIWGPNNTGIIETRLN